MFFLTSVFHIQHRYERIHTGMLPWLGGTGFESQLGWLFMSYHLILVCVNYDLNGSLRINSRLHARLNNQLSHPSICNWYTVPPIQALYPAIGILYPQSKHCTLQLVYCAPNPSIVPTIGVLYPESKNCTLQLVYCAPNLSTVPCNWYTVPPIQALYLAIGILYLIQALPWNWYTVPPIQALYPESKHCTCNSYTVSPNPSTVPCDWYTVPPIQALYPNLKLEDSKFNQFFLEWVATIENFKKIHPRLFEDITDIQINELQNITSFGGCNKLKLSGFLIKLSWIT